MCLGKNQHDSFSLTPPPETEQGLKLNFQTALHKRSRSCGKSVLCWCGGTIVGESIVDWTETITDMDSTFFLLMLSEHTTRQKIC